MGILRRTGHRWAEVVVRVRRQHTPGNRRELFVRVGVEEAHQVLIAAGQRFHAVARFSLAAVPHHPHPHAHQGIRGLVRDPFIAAAGLMAENQQPFAERFIDGFAARRGEEPAIVRAVGAHRAAKFFRGDGELAGHDFPRRPRRAQFRGAFEERGHRGRGEGGHGTTRVRGIRSRMGCADKCSSVQYDPAVRCQINPVDFRDATAAFRPPLPQ